MGLVIRLIELLLLAAPLIGLLIAGIKAVSAFNRREAGSAPAADDAPVDAGKQSGNPAAHWRAIRRAVEAHERTDARWLEYELDAARLLDFPAMTDLRDPLTARFHKAKLAAELLKPLRAEDLIEDKDGAQLYLEAVGEYVTAFDAAEAEAIRRRRGDFSPDEQQRLARAQSLLRVAADTAATAPERQRAYGLARTELEGLVVLPVNTRAGIERGVAGEIDD